MAVTPESPDFPHAHGGGDAPAEHDAAAYMRGSMTIEEQASTYSLFMGLAKWGSLAVACVLLFLVMWFRPEGNLFGGLIAAVVMAVAGWWFLRSKPEAH